DGLRGVIDEDAVGAGVGDRVAHALLADGAVALGDELVRVRQGPVVVGRAADGDAGRLEALAQRLRHGLAAIADDGEDERHWLTATRVAPRRRRPEHDQRIASRRLLQLKMREGKDQVNHQASPGPVLLRLEPLLLPLAAGARLEQLGAGAEGELERRGGALALAAGAQDVRQAL